MDGKIQQINMPYQSLFMQDEHIAQNHRYFKTL